MDARLNCKWSTWDRDFDQMVSLLYTALCVNDRWNWTLVTKVCDHTHCKNAPCECGSFLCSRKKWFLCLCACCNVNAIKRLVWLIDQSVTFCFCTSVLFPSPNIPHYFCCCLQNTVVGHIHTFSIQRLHRWGGGGGGGRLQTYRYTFTTRMIPALRWAAMGAILMFSRMWWTKSQDNVHKHNLFEEKGEPKRYRTEVFCQVGHSSQL